MDWLFNHRQRPVADRPVVNTPGFFDAAHPSPPEIPPSTQETMQRVRETTDALSTDAPPRFTLRLPNDTPPRPSQFPLNLNPYGPNSDPSALDPSLSRSYEYDTTQDTVLNRLRASLAQIEEEELKLPWPNNPEAPPFPLDPVQNPAAAREWYSMDWGAIGKATAAAGAAVGARAAQFETGQTIKAATVQSLAQPRYSGGGSTGGGGGGGGYSRPADNNGGTILIVGALVLFFLNRQ